MQRNTPDNSSFIETTDNTEEAIEILDEQQVAEVLMTFWQVSKSLVTSAAPIAGSSTMSIQLVIFGLLLVHFSENENMLASVALFIKVFGFMIIALSPIFPAGMIIRNQLGELQAAETADPSADHTELYDKISATGKSMMIMATITSPISICTFYFSEALLTSVFRQADTISAIAQSTLRLYAISIPGQITRTVTNELLNGFNKMIPGMIISLSSLSASTLLGLALSFGWFGNTPMNRTGTLIGAIVEPYFTAGVCAIYLRVSPHFTKFHFLSTRNHPYILPQLRSISSLSIPAFIAISVDMLSGMAYNALIGITGGKNALAATSILNQLGSITSLLRPSLAQATSLNMSYYAGTRQFSQTSNYSRKATIAASCLLVPIPLVISVAPNLLVLMSGQTVNSMTFIRELAPIIGWTQIMEGIKANLLHQLNAVNDNVLPTCISGFGMAGGVVVGAFTGIFTDGEAFALTGSYAAFLTASTTALGIRWYFSTRPARIEQQQLARTAIYGKTGSATFFSCCKKRGKNNGTSELLVKSSPLIQHN